MTSISITEYIHELKEAGFTDKQAETQSRKLEQIIVDVKSNIHEEIKKKDLVTKADLKAELKELELKLVKWVIGSSIGGVIAIAGLIKYLH